MLDFKHSRLLPFKHQQEDTEVVVNHSYFFITSEMRTGKTKICIDAAQFLYIQGIIDRVIVVAPAPVRDVWFDKDFGELQKHLWLNIPARVTEIHQKNRSWDWGPKEDKLEWFITNYEFIRGGRLKQILQYCTPETLLILDESSFVKSYRAAQTKACMELRYKCGRVILLNGTPISHSPLDLFSQGNLLHPSILECRFITHFRSRYAIMTPVRGPGGKALKDKWGNIIEAPSAWINLDDLQRRFAPYTVCRLQKDCLDLPPKLESVILTASLTVETWRIYKEMRDECVAMFESSNASIAAQAVVKAIRLRQITSGFIGGVQHVELDNNFDDVNDRVFDCIDENGTNQIDNMFGESSQNINKISGDIREIGREKLDVLLWFLEQRLEQIENLHIVVWCAFRVELFRMLNEVEKKFTQFQMGSILGGQKKEDRLRSLALLHPDTSPKGPVFVGGTFGTGSYGLNFTAANHSVNCSFDYSLGKFKQAGDRVYGPGMIGPAAYFDIIATGPRGEKTIDHIIVKARRERSDIADMTRSAWIKALRDE